MIKQHFTGKIAGEGKLLLKNSINPLEERFYGT
jgi:hypothetical protein